MRFDGSSSWSTGESQDKGLHRLLYVRQAVVGRAETVLRAVTHQVEMDAHR